MSPVWSQRRLPAKVIEKVFDISKKKKKEGPKRHSHWRFIEFKFLFTLQKLMNAARSLLAPSLFLSSCISLSAATFKKKCPDGSTLATSHPE